MSKPADPALLKCYKDWLAIHTGGSPPDYYQLLGLPPKEANVATIKNAARQRSITVRQFQIGEHGPIAQLILDEIAKAKTCLLDPQAKVVYDRNLAGMAEEPLELTLADELPQEMKKAPRPNFTQLSPPIPTPVPAIHAELPSLADAELDSLLDASISEAFLSSASKALPPASPMGSMFARLEAKAYLLMAGIVLGGLALLMTVSSLMRATSPGKPPKEVPAVASAAETKAPTSQTSSSPDFWPKQNATPKPAKKPARSSSEEDTQPKQKSIGNPFLRLAKDVDLPPVPASALGTSDLPGISLGFVPRDRIPEVEIILTPQSGLLSCPLTFKLNPGTISDSLVAWDIVAVAKDAATGKDSVVGAHGASRVVAQLYFIGQELQFRWKGPSLGPVLEHLRYCSLTCTAGEFTQVISLRVIPAFDPIVFNLAEKRQTTKVPIGPLPPGAELSFEIYRVDNLTNEYRLTPPDGISRSSKSVGIKLDPYEFTVSLTDVPELTIVVMGKYVVRNQAYDFHPTQLQEHRLGILAKIQNDEVNLARCVESGRIISHDMFVLEQYARNTASVTDKLAANDKWGKLAARLKVLQTTVKRIHRSRPILEADLATVAGITELLNTLESRPQVHLLLKASVGEQAFDVARFGGY